MEHDQPHALCVCPFYEIMSFVREDVTISFVVPGAKTPVLFHCYIIKMNKINSMNGKYGTDAPLLTNFQTYKRNIQT